MKPCNHLSAMAIAALLIFGLGLQDLDLQPVLGRFDDRQLRDYTPYFPGLDALDRHEVLSPSYQHTKKIVLLGGSAIDSIGCDSTWTRADKSRQPTKNAAFFCSIASNMNEQLQTFGLGDWRVFNLARAGASLTPMLYVYAQIAVVKPEIVIFGDTYFYYLHKNAGAGDLRPDHYAYLHKVFGTDDTTAAIWSSYWASLIQHGLTPPVKVDPPPDLSVDFQPRDRTTLSDLLVRLLTMARNSRWADGPPLPIKFAPDFGRWDEITRAFKNFDPEFRYIQGLRLIAELQKRHSGKLFVVFGPDYKRGNNLSYLHGINDILGGYLRENEIPFSSHVALGLKPIYETYDGSHQTLYGNRIIAARLLRDLMKHNLIN